MKKYLLICLLTCLLLALSITGCSLGTSDVAAHKANGDKTRVTTVNNNTTTSIPDSSADTKSSYEVAQEYLGSGKFLEAFIEFSKVEYSDDNYEDAIDGRIKAKELYVQALNDEIAKASDEEAIQNILIRINDAMNIFEDDSLDEVKSNCETKLSEAKAQNQLQKDMETIDSTFDGSNYSNILDVLFERANSFYDSYGNYLEYKKSDQVGDNIKFTYSGSAAISDCIQAYFDKYYGILNAYEEQSLNEADKIFSETRDYTKAIQTLNKYIGCLDTFSSFTKKISNDTVYFSATNVESKIEYYKEFIPVLLTDIVPSRQENVTINRLGGWTTVDPDTYNQDTDGKVYDSTIMPNDESGSVTYYVNFKYSLLEGIIYRPFYSIGGNGETASMYKDGWVKIYGDGILLYESPKITQNTYETYTFNVDISGVRELTIELGGTWYPGWGHLATVGVANAIISKE